MVLDVAVMRELVGVVALALVHDPDGVPDELVHAVVAGARADLGQVGLLDDALACTVLVVGAVA